MKLLIAEDDEGVSALIRATVPETWDVHIATDGIQALELARRVQPDAIILDHSMPVLNGTEVCDLLGREAWRPGCTVVALTGQHDPQVRREMTRAGADAFLEKPFSPLELLELIGAWNAHRA